MDEENVFPGFIYPAPKGHTQIPNLWYDEIVSRIDNVAELKVVLYILRHTCGFQRAEEAQRLTVDEFMNGRIFNGRRIDRGTGLSEMSVRNGLKNAVKHGYIVCESDNSDKGNIKKCYKLRFLEVQTLDPKQELEVQTLDPTGTNSIPVQVQNLGEKGTNFRPQSPSGEKERERKEKERMKESDSSIHSFDQSSSQRADATAFIRMFMRKFLLEMGATGKLMDDHLRYLQDLYHFSGLDKEAFRSKAEFDMDKTRQLEGDLGEFYQYFHKSIGWQQSREQ
jgi:hypothetical protein